MNEKKKFPTELHEEDLKVVSGGKRIQMCMPEKDKHGEGTYSGYCPFCGSGLCQIFYKPGMRTKGLVAVCWECWMSFECDLPDSFTG